VSGYAGIIYVNYHDNRIVVAHRGTDSLKSLAEDLSGVYLNRLSSQKQAVFSLIREAIEMAKMQRAGLSFTGHSLGAFLAEISVFYCHKSFNFPDVHAVTFESPGSVESLEKMQSNLEGEKVEITTLDIVSYLSYPNIINTCNHHTGTLYQLEPDLGNYGWLAGWYTKKSHSMDGIIGLFQENGWPLKIQYVEDWPIGSQMKVFFEMAKFDSGYYKSLSEEQLIEQCKDRFKLEYEAHYIINNSLSHTWALPLRHFNLKFQAFLISFYKWKKQASQEQEEELRKRLVIKKIPESIIESLMDYNLEQRRGIAFLKLKEEKDIIEFRRELSEWLSKDKNASSINELIFSSNQQPLLEVISAIMAPGSKVLSGGILKNASVKGVDISIPEDTRPENVTIIKDLLEKIQTGTKKIEAYVLSPDTEIGGHVENVHACGAAISIRERYANNPLITHGFEQMKSTHADEKSMDDVSVGNKKDSSSSSKQSYAPIHLI
ncbi:MAG: Mbeg1-like protein, partial [Gammaproteobacteria bacterium]